MKLMIVAGHDYPFTFGTFEMLDRLTDSEGNSASKIVTRVGGAKQIEAYAQARGLPVVRIVPDFEAYKDRAILNCLREMVLYSDVMVIFPGGFESMEAYLAGIETQIKLYDFRGMI